MSLYKTDFDGSYNNVVDIYREYNVEINPFNIFVDYLTYYYTDKIDINMNGYRGVKSAIQNIMITVPKSFNELYDYNYCVLFTDSRPYFYFITDVLSANDGVTPSATLNLRKDVWTSNLDKIYGKSAFNNITTKHFNRFDIDEVDGTIKPKFIFNPSVNVQLKKTEIVDTSSNTSDEVKRRYLPLYMVIQYKNFPDLTDHENPLVRSALFYNFLFSYNSQSYSAFIHPFDSVNGKYLRNIQYGIVGIYDVVEGEILSDWRVKSKEFSYMLTRIPDSPDVVTGLKTPPITKIGFPTVNTILPEELRPIVDGIYFTFNSPISLDDYEINVSGRTIDYKNHTFIPCSSIENALTLEQKVSAYMPILLGDYNSAFNLPTDPSYELTYKPFINNIDIDKVDIIKIQPTYITNYGGVLTDLVYCKNNSDLIDPSLYSKPFKYQSIVVGGDVIDLTPFSPTNYNGELKIYKDAPQTTLNLFDSEGNKILSPTRMFVDMPKLISYGTSQLDVYLANNSAQHQTAKQVALTEGALRLISSAASIVANPTPVGVVSGVSGAASGVFNTINKLSVLEARINSLKNAPYIYTPSMGECDKWFIDRVAIINNECYDDDIIYNSYKNAISIYGYPVETYANVFSNNRRWFDYCETNKCSLIDINIPIEDKKILEDAFNSGIFKWHIHIDSDGNFVEAPSRLSFSTYKKYNIENDVFKIN